MRRTCAVVCALLFLTGCSGESTELERGMELRSRLLKAERVSFSADIVADYGDKLHMFSMDCVAAGTGDLTFEVSAPDTLSGISGRITGEEGKLTFDGTGLCFELLTDDQLSPVSAPWILMKTLCSGYIVSAGQEEERLRLMIDDSYEDNSLRLDIWLDGQDLPQQAQISDNGRTILMLTVRNFQIL